MNRKHWNVVRVVVLSLLALRIGVHLVGCVGGGQVSRTTTTTYDAAGNVVGQTVTESASASGEAKRK